MKLLANEVKSFTQSPISSTYDIMKDIKPLEGAKIDKVCITILWLHCSEQCPTYRSSTLGSVIMTSSNHWQQSWNSLRCITPYISCTVYKWSSNQIMDSSRLDEHAHIASHMIPGHALPSQDPPYFLTREAVDFAALDYLTGFIRKVSVWPLHRDGYSPHVQSQNWSIKYMYRTWILLKTNVILSTCP